MDSFQRVSIPRQQRRHSDSRHPDLPDHDAHRRSHSPYSNRPHDPKPQEHSQGPPISRLPSNYGSTRCNTARLHLTRRAHAHPVHLPLGTTFSSFGLARLLLPSTTRITTHNPGLATLDGSNAAYTHFSLKPIVDDELLSEVGSEICLIL